LLFSSVMRVLLFCAFLAACGFEAPRQDPERSVVDAAQPPMSTPTIDAPLAPVLTPRAFIEELARLECVAAFACKPQYPTSAPRTFDQAWGTDITSCIAIDTNYLERDAIDAAVAAGRITFDAASAQACLAAPGIPASCAALFEYGWTWSSICFVGLAGHVPDGAACATSWECGPLSDCHRGTCSH
jgi:hypothetical protein